MTKTLKYKPPLHPAAYLGQAIEAIFTLQDVGLCTNRIQPRELQRFSAYEDVTLANSPSRREGWVIGENDVGNLDTNQTGVCKAMPFNLSFTRVWCLFHRRISVVPVLLKLEF